MEIVPDPFAFKVRFSLVAEDIVVIEGPPAPAALPLIPRPDAADVTDASIFKTGLVLPFGPTASAFAELEVTPNAPPSAVGPLTASALLPIVAPAIATEAAEAAPRDGVVNDGETVMATVPVARDRKFADMTDIVEEHAGVRAAGDQRLYQ